LSQLHFRGVAQVEGIGIAFEFDRFLCLCGIEVASAVFEIEAWSGIVIVFICFPVWSKIKSWFIFLRFFYYQTLSIGLILSRYTQT
jgi:hypothetical protein